MIKPKVILHLPHTQIVEGQVERCCHWTLTEAVEGITTSEVGAVVDDNWMHEAVVEEMKRLAVADINSKQATYTFDESDCIDWEL